MRFIAWLTILMSFLLVESAICAPYTDRIDSIPDIAQTDPSAQFPDGGSAFCGPCAVSNSLFWLGGNGYGNLLPRAKEPFDIHVELTKLIASPQYMDTSSEWGTSPASLIEGVAKYLHDCGYDYKELSYQGWRNVPRRFQSGIKTPQPEWIKAGLEGDSAVWLNVGWYRFSPEKREYLRVGGHWVTLAGYGLDKNGQEDPNVFIVHDPGTRSVQIPPNEFIRLEKIRVGTIVSRSGLRQDAKGLFKLHSIIVDSQAQLGILDGVIHLEMKRPNT